MKLGVLTVPLYDRPLEEALKWLHERGVQAVELGAGGSPGKGHLDPAEYLGHPERIEELKALLARYDITVAALSCHGNPVHPNPDVAARDHRDFEQTVLMAEQLGVDTVVTFSGCPGGSAADKTPNWVTCAWPDDFQRILQYQWDEVLIPYWKKAAAFAADHGVTRIALEMHPGFCVYNTVTLLRLRDAVGDAIGANLDPSHLIWQGTDPAEAARTLGDAIYHVHAKDTYVDMTNVRQMGVLSATPYGDILHRPWTFRTVGYGLDESAWKAFVSMLRLVGYDRTVSIEHEDALMSVEDGLDKAIAFLRRIMAKPLNAQAWW
ncbi:MAG: sugar phosphate isomerase/epimerase family protein [Acutalibacteraceae bacterium]|jgi:sugar phosphate isomerase/epimerase